MRPCLLGTTSQDWGLGFGQVPDKSSGFVRPPAANFSAQDNQSGAAVPPVELRIIGLLAPPCCGEGCAADVSATGMWSPVPTKWRHHGGVYGELCAVEQGQPVHHDFYPPIIQSVRRCQIHILDSDVCRDPASCFPTYPRCGRLQGESPATQHPRHGARCAVMATGIEWQATPAGTTGRG